MIPLVDGPGWRGSRLSVLLKKLCRRKPAPQAKRYGYQDTHTRGDSDTSEMVQKCVAQKCSKLVEIDDGKLNT